MRTIKFRDLTADELELRVGTTNEKGFTLLVYKTARADANVLDETVGAFNWQKRFYQVKNTMICSLGINVNYDDEEKEPLWIFKDDAGDESNTEAVKGEASDSFKRAGFAWGIARKLYESPFIWINKDNDNDPKKSRYAVKEIQYSETSVVKIVVVNEKSKQEFTFTNYSNSSQKPQKVAKKDSVDENAPLREEERLFLQDYVGTLSPERYNKFFDWLNDKFGTRKIAELTASQGIIAVSILKRSKNND